jgi:hypothetical protein
METIGIWRLGPIKANDFRNSGISSGIFGSDYPAAYSEKIGESIVPQAW